MAAKRRTPRASKIGGAARATPPPPAPSAPGPAPAPAPERKPIAPLPGSPAALAMKPQAAAVSRPALEQFLAEAAALYMGGKSAADRRAYVGKLMARQVKRADILRHVCPVYGVRAGAVDKDITWVRDNMLKGVKEMKEGHALADVMGTADEVVRQGFERGDLHAAHQANRHRGELLGLTGHRAEDGAPAAGALGVIVLPAKEAEALWLKTHGVAPARQGDKPAKAKRKK